MLSTVGQEIKTHCNAQPSFYDQPRLFIVWSFFLISANAEEHVPQRIFIFFYHYTFISTSRLVKRPISSKRSVKLYFGGGGDAPTVPVLL